jgi:hypothetical protein
MHRSGDELVAGKSVIQNEDPEHQFLLRCIQHEHRVGRAEEPGPVSPLLFTRELNTIGRWALAHAAKARNTTFSARYEDKTSRYYELIPQLQNGARSPSTIAVFLWHENCVHVETASSGDRDPLSRAGGLQSVTADGVEQPTEAPRSSPRATDCP